MWMEGAASVVLVAVTVLIHYEALRPASAFLEGLKILPRPRILVVIFFAFAAHLMEVALFAAAYYVLIEAGGWGALRRQWPGPWQEAQHRGAASGTL